MNDCIFCKIVSGEIPSYKIYEDEYAYAFLDISCDSVGHTLVIPKKHCVNVLDCGADDLQAVTAAVQKISRHYVENCGYTGVNVLNASGKSAQQSVFHLHFHIIPLIYGEGLNNWGLNDRFDMNLAEICERLAIK